jgi:Zn-dependent protease with chaperone function
VTRTRSAWLGLLLLATGACTTVPERTYYPDPASPETRLLAEALWRATKAASDDPTEYSFAMIRSTHVATYTVEDATFYFTQGLARQPTEVVEPLVAHEVAHELLGHIGQRRALALSLGASLTDLLANPLIVRVFTRDQEIAADLKAVEVLRDMGYATPRRAMADALRAAAKVNGRPRGGWLATEPALEDRLSRLEPLEADNKQVAK